jgi:hypothetical protein
MLNHLGQFIAMIEISALGVLGLTCLILVCFGLPAELIHQVLKKPKKLLKREKRIPAMDQLSHWDYLIIIIPVWLMLISIFSTDYGEQRNCIILLSVGCTGLPLSFYNDRAEFFNGRLLLFLSCLLPAIFSVIVKYFSLSISFFKEINILYAPVLAFAYLLFARFIIKELTGMYPITLDRHRPVGTYYDRYKRITTYWDLLWTVINFFVIVILLILCGR